MNMMKEFGIPLKDVLDFTDEELSRMYGEYAFLGREIIERRKCDIQNGYIENWSARRELWDKKERATDTQEEMICISDYECLLRGLTKYKASFIIDMIIFDREMKNAIRNHVHKLEVQRKKAELERAKEEKRRIKLAIRESKVRIVSEKTLHKWRTEFNELWNKILDDDKIELSEALTLKEWLMKHKRRYHDYDEMIACIDSAISDGEISSDETQSIYECALKVVDTLYEEVN